MIALTSEYSSLNTLDHSDSNETNCDKRTAERSSNVANYAKKQNGAALRRHCSSGNNRHVGGSAIQKPLAMVRPHRIQLNAQHESSSFGSASASIQEIFVDNNADINLSSRQQKEQQQNNKPPIYLREARSLDHMPLQLQLRKNQHRHQQQQQQQQQTLLQQQQQHQYQPQHQHQYDHELLNQKLFKMSRNNSRSLDTGVSLITTPRTILLSTTTATTTTTTSTVTTTTTTTDTTATNNTYISNSNEMHKSVDKRHLVDAQQQVFEESEEDNEERTNEKTGLIMQLNNGKITKAQTTTTTTTTTNDNQQQQQQQQQQIRPITLKPKNSTKTTTTKIRTNRNRRNAIKTISLAPTTTTTETTTINVCNGSLSHKEDMTHLLPTSDGSATTTTTTTTTLKSRKGKRWHSLETINQCRSGSGSGSGSGNGSGNGNGNGSGKCFSRGNSISYATPADAAAQNYYFTKKQQRYFGGSQQQKQQQQNNCLQTSGRAETNSSTFSSWLVNFIQGNSIPANERSLRRSNLLRNRVRDQYDTNMPGFVDLTNAQRDRESIV